MKKYSDVSDHIMSSRCFNTCAKWKLSLTVTANKTSSGIVID